MTQRSENIWLGSFFAFLFLMILSTLFCAPCYCQRIEAENYTAMFGINKETCLDVGGGQNIANLSVGDYAGYTVNIPAGTYNISARVATVLDQQKFQLKTGNTVLCTFTVPNTGGYQKWTTVTVNNVVVPALTSLTILSQGFAFNINWFDFIPTGTIPPVIIPPTGTYSKAQTDSAIKATFNSYPDLILKKSVVAGALDTLIFPFTGIKVYQLVKIYQ